MYIVATHSAGLISLLDIGFLFFCSLCFSFFSSLFDCLLVCLFACLLWILLLGSLDYGGDKSYRFYFLSMASSSVS